MIHHRNPPIDREQCEKKHHPEDGQWVEDVTNSVEMMLQHIDTTHVTALSNIQYIPLIRKLTTNSHINDIHINNK